MKNRNRTDVKNKRKGCYFILVLLILAVSGLSIAAALKIFPSELSAFSSEISSAKSSQTVSSALPSSSSVPDPVSITILGAGDDLIHDNIYRQAQKRAGGSGYDFDFVYQRVADQIKKADISVVNQETVIAGAIAEPSGYPRFNSPTQLGEEMVKIGFDVINHANNHLLDLGEKGIKATLDFWDTQPIKVVGAYRDEEDLNTIRIVESHGIKTAHIGITEMTNGLSLPKGSPYKIIYAKNTQLIERLIKKAKSMADVVVISVHWGQEDTYKLTDSQKNLAQEMVDWGADIIFGNHPHVVQKLTLLTRASDGAKCPVIFAMGNFVSSQLYGRNMVSGFLTVTMTKNYENNKTLYSNMIFTPIVTHYGNRCSNVTIYPFRDYTDTLAKAHGVRRYTPDFSRKFVQDIIDRSIPEEYQE